LVLKLGEQRIGTSGQQHHSHQERDHCFDGHASGLVGLRSRPRRCSRGLVVSEETRGIKSPGDSGTAGC
jgi:hypothetical protein